MNNIRQRHGIPDARKVTMTGHDTQFISVTDGEEDEVLLNIGTATHTAGMTVEQARYIAREIVHSAARVEARLKGAPKAKQP
jgi:transketolase N-terminal domain/subunit